MTAPTILTAPPAVLPDLGRTLLTQWLTGSGLETALVVTPSRAVGRSLIQAVAREAGGATGLRAVTLPDLAREMAAPRLDRWILPPRADRVISAQLLTEDAGPDADLALKLPVAAAMARSLRDLREAGIESLPAEELLGDLSRADRFRFEHFGRLFRRLCHHLKRQRLADDAELYRCAGEGPIPGNAARLLVYGIYDVTGVQRELLGTLAGRVELTWLCPAAAETTPAAELVESLLDWAETRGFERQSLALETARGGADAAFGIAAKETRILACPGEHAEATEVARDILCAAAEGFAFGEMAVILSSADAQERTFREAFRRAGIPVTGRARRRLLDQPRGRALVALAGLAGGAGGREEVAAVLRAALESEAEPEIPPASVSRILRMAGCGAPDADDWGRRLEQLARALSRDEAALADADELDPDEARRARVESADRVRHLAARAEVLLLRLDDFRASLAPARKRPWRELAHDLVALAAQVGLRADDGGELFDAAADAASRLKAWDRLGLAPRADLALDLWLENMLELEAPQTAPADDGSAPAPRLEGLRGGEAVLLLDINQARGLQSRAAWLSGLTHDLFAPPGRPDPLLGDTLRRRLARATGCLLRTSADRFRERELLFALGAAAGRERLTLSWPRFEDVTGQIRLPVDALADLIEARGDVPDPDDVTSSPAVDRRPAEAPLLAHDTTERPLIRLEEYDQAAIRAADPAAMGHLDEDSHLARALRADRARFVDRRYNEHCGLVGSQAPAVEGLSATGIEELARCPFRYFLGRVLGLEPRSLPPPLGEPEPRELGSLAHRLLEDLFRAFPKGEPPAGQELAQALGRIRRLLDLRVREAVGQGSVGAMPLWLAMGDAITARLERYVAAECERMRSLGLRVERAELPLGRELDLAGRPVRVRGRADRVDRDGDDALRIVDYKWSKGRWLPSRRRGELLLGGRSLQLPLYAWMLEEDDAAPDVIEYRYAPLKANSPEADFVVHAPDLAERRDELPVLVEKLVGFAGRGEFLPVPDGRRNCGTCPYLTVCGPRLGWIEEHKAEDPRYIAHRRLREEHP